MATGNILPNTCPQTNVGTEELPEENVEGDKEASTSASAYWKLGKALVSALENFIIKKMDPELTIILILNVVSDLGKETAVRLKIRDVYLTSAETARNEGVSTYLVLYAHRKEIEALLSEAMIKKMKESIGTVVVFIGEEAETGVHGVSGEEVGRTLYQ